MFHMTDRREYQLERNISKWNSLSNVAMFSLRVSSTLVTSSLLRLLTIYFSMRYGLWI